MSAPLGEGFSVGWLAATAGLPGAVAQNIPGRKNSISAAAGVMDDISQIPGTVIVPDPGGIQLEVVSSSAGDTDPGGAGIRTLAIIYLDDDNLSQVEIVAMAGVAPVLTAATDINKVQCIRAETVGSGGVAAGNITLRGVGAGTAYEYIALGGNQSLTCRLHIPANKRAYITRWSCSGITKEIDFRLRATVDRGTHQLMPGVFLFQDAMVLNDEASGNIIFSIPILLPPLSTVKVSGRSAAAGGDGGATIEVLMVEN